MGKNKTKAKRAESLQQALEKQYPSVDPSLVADLLGEIDSAQGTQVEELHKTLASLSVSDDFQMLDQTSLTSGSVSDPFNDSSSSPVTDETSSSCSSLSTPLAFLQRSFPDTASSVLQAALDEHGSDNLELIIDTLLSNDLIREMQERDTWESSIPHSLDLDSVEEWTKQKIPPAPPPPQPKAKSKGKSKGKGKTTVVMGDVLQRHLAQPRAIAEPAVDPWTYIDSVATELGSILGNVPSSVFSSAFHSGAYSTPAIAIRSTLARLGTSNTVDEFALAELLELLGASADDVADATLCLRATGSQPDDAFRLVEFLRQVERANPVIARFSPAGSAETSVPAGPPEVQPVRRKSVTVGVVSPAKSAWGSPVRTNAAAVGLAAVPGSSEWIKAARAGTAEPHEGVDEQDAAACLAEAAYWQDRHRAALKQASKLYTRRRHEYGAEAALYYSNQARDYAAKDREWRLKAAKASVKAKQEQSSSKAIDLHGLTVHESLEIVKESVNAWWSSAGSGSAPRAAFEIITGQGRHSKGNVPVIAPAVTKLLERDGWRFYKRDGIVYVTGVMGR